METMTFEEYLKSNRLVQARYISYYCHWVKKFAGFCKTRERLSWDRVGAYLFSMRYGCKDFQVRQADHAIRISGLSDRLGVCVERQLCQIHVGRTGDSLIREASQHVGLLGLG